MSFDGVFGIGLAMGTILLAAEIGVLSEGNIVAVLILFITFIALAMFLFAVGLIPFYTTVLMSQMKDSLNEELGSCSFVKYCTSSSTV